MWSVPGFLAWRSGDPRRLVLTVVDAEGDPVDLSASTWTAQVRASRSSATATTLTTDATAAAVGVLTFTLTGEQTRALTAHTVYGDVEGSAHGTLLEFKANVGNDVTRVLDGDDTVEPTGGLADVLTVSLTQDTVQLVAQSVAAITLTGGPGGASDAEDVAVTPAGGLVATDVQAALVELDTEKASVSALDAETSSRVAADTALDGRLATVEGDYLQSADITDMETTTGAQAKADAAQAAAVQRANHTGVQPSTTISDFTEAVQDAVAALLGAGSNVVLTYDDASDTLTIDSVGDGTGLDAEAVRDAIGVALVGAGLVSVAVNDALDTITISTSATANSTDAALRDRTTHTGTQAIATVSGLQAALDAKVPASTFDANTILKADTDDTPVALPVPASRLVGRKATGGIAAITTAELVALAGTPDGTKFLADDGTLKTPSGGSSSTFMSFLAGQYYAPGGATGWGSASPSSTAANSNGLTRFVPFYLPAGKTIDRVAIAVSTAPSNTPQGDPSDNNWARCVRSGAALATGAYTDLSSAALVDGQANPRIMLRFA